MYVCNAIFIKSFFCDKINHIFYFQITTLKKVISFGREKANVVKL